MPPSVPQLASAYGAPVDFRIRPTAPRVTAPISADLMNDILKEQYNFYQQVISALITECGIDSLPRKFWPTLQGTESGLNGGNADKIYVPAIVALSFGSLVTLTSVGGILKANIAASVNNTKPCFGYCSAVQGAGIGDVTEVTLSRGVCHRGGTLTQGAVYYLGLTGLPTTTPPVATGNIEQYIGFALDASNLYFNVGSFIQH